MTNETTIEVSSFIDGRAIGRFQWTIYALCLICVMTDGFDLQVLSFAAPSIIREWKISSAIMGPVFSAALVGILIGSLLLSLLADRIGRRPVLIGATVWFAALTWMTGHSASVHEMTILRFLAGIGLGGIMPNAMALAGEYSPARRRVLIMMIVSAGFTAGALAAGLTTEWLIGYGGWRAMFTFGSGAALLIAVTMVVFLPESLSFLALRGGISGRTTSPRTRRWIQRLAPEAMLSEMVTLSNSSREPRLHLSQLFLGGRAVTTILLWGVNFLNLLNLYFLTSWLPTAVRDIGFANTIAVRAGSLAQAGGLAGGLLLGWFAQRLRLTRVLTLCFLAGCVGLATISRPGLPLQILFAAVFLAGFSISGGQVGVNALTAICYPTSLRATGIGASLSVGRIGAILGPAIAGTMIGWHWQPRSLFLAATVPAFLSAFAVLAVRPRAAGSQ